MPSIGSSDPNDSADLISPFDLIRLFDLIRSVDPIDPFDLKGRTSQLAVMP